VVEPVSTTNENVLPHAGSDTRRLHRWREALLERLGGPARTKVVLILALVLGLDSAALGAVGAMADNLYEALGISHSDVGLLVTVSEGAGAIGTLFFGWLTDRTNRTRMLAIVVALWAVEMAVMGFATGYAFLLVASIGLGLLAAAATPSVASLLGDYIPQQDRAKIYGAVLSGEVIGTAFGFVASGLLASLSWRLGFWVLALPALPIAFALHRLPEPARGGASQLSRGARCLRSPPSEREAEKGPRRFVAIEARRAGVTPRARLVRDEEPAQGSLWWAVRYVLAVPTNLVLIFAGTLGYFFFAGVRVFGVELLRSQFGLSHVAAVGLMVGVGSGALFGVLVGGWLSDHLLARGYLRIRVQVGIVAMLVCAALFTLALLVNSFWWTAILLFLSAAGFGAINSSVDAARLDIVVPGVWGRAEAIRVALRKAGEAGAPLLVGALIGAFGGGASAMRSVFLLLTMPLYVGGLVGTAALKTYLPDAVSADEYAQRRR
jgi:predicted MFS family arabinose efflux permease